MSKDDTFKVEFRISNIDVSIPPLKPITPPPTLGETILEGIHSDMTRCDIFFTFDDPGDTQSAGDELDTSSVSSTIQDEDGSVDASGKGQEDPDPLHVKSLDQVRVLKAHKLVLLRWPYFRAMFESGFAEGGLGEKRIWIKDTKFKTFELLLRFMCTARLAQDFIPKTTYTDKLEDKEDASLEDLFLAADRYNVKELRDQILKPLLAGLDATNAIPFLFRVAYKFFDVRKPTIQFVAKTFGLATITKDLRNTYKDHPDAFDIVMDLLEAHVELHP